MKEFDVIPAVGPEETPTTKKRGPAKEALVSVEMTEAQKEKVVAILAGQDQAKKDAQEAEEIVEVNLRFAHRRNGTTYGPGRIHVRADVGASLHVADEAHYASRLAENDGGKHLIELGLGGYKKVTRNVKSL